MSETIGDYVARLWRRGDVGLFVAPWPITIPDPPRDADRAREAAERPPRPSRPSVEP